MNRKPGLVFAAIATLTVLSACSPDERVETATVLTNTNCKGVAVGLHEVTLAEVARMRGSELIASTAIRQPAVLDSAATTSADTENDIPRFIAISRGPQPSRGFELHLANQAKVITPTQLQVPVYWTSPDLEKSHPLVTTRPCLVVSLPQGPWEQVEAIDQHGQSLGTLQLAP